MGQIEGSFPQGLKPSLIFAAPNIRAEARTVQADPLPSATLALPYATGLRRVQRLPFLAAEGFAEFVEVLYGSVDAPAPKRVGIGQGCHASNLLGFV